MKSEREELQFLLKSKFPIIVVETPEERRFLDLIENVANLEDQPLFTWSAVQGLRRPARREHSPNTRDLALAVQEIPKSPQNGVYVFFDAMPFLDNPEVIRTIREIAFDHDRTHQTMVFVGSRVALDPDLQRMSASFRPALIGAAEVRKLVKEEFDNYNYQMGTTGTRGDQAAYEMLVQHLVGLSRDDARRLVRQSIEHEGAITLDDVARVLKLKHESLGQGGTLQMVTEVESLERVGGQARFKKWLELRRGAFLRKPGTEKLDAPKGVLLLGVQGAGKSLAARAVAGAWRVPLLRLDFGALYNKFHGETERNLRTALETAANMSPCILWLDEIEKGVASGGEGDGGVSRRVLGTLLTWMSERKERVFLIATANDIESLPPELLRKGRFDEIFFVDLPAPESRAEIFRIHLAKRGHAVEAFDVGALAGAAERFSGAEIEQAIIAAAYAAHSEGNLMETRHVLEELASTRPLAVVRREQVAALRAWAEDRTVPAD
ncbi:MAG TPA: AAA family ATPase [Usitatibacter sp.]|nr:AAA family ATPase [Usitatibacter sp.]